MNVYRILLATAFVGLGTMAAEARTWTLRQCIDYALENNITLQKGKLQTQSAQEDVLQSQAALLPSLSFNTNQNITFNPWPQTGRAIVAGDQVQASVDKVYYNGTYAINANWTVWNGNVNHNTIKANKIAAEQAQLDNAVAANSIQEQIAQLYIQILYTLDAKKVSEAALATSKRNEERGAEFVKAGSMSKADQAQLSAQRAQDEYSVAQAEGNVREYTRQLKQLLQITDSEPFEVVADDGATPSALQDIPSMQAVYDAALASRPEIKNAQLGIQASDINIKIAKAGKLPTVGLSAGLTTNTTTMSGNAWSSQLKNNFNIGAGFTVSVPLTDQRKTKTAVNKAQIQRMSYELDLRDKQTQLYAAIENYWIQANTNQSMYKAAQASTESAKASYDLLNEQFNLGMKNVVELLTGRDNMLKAQQSELQSKYLTMLNINMLNFYKSGNIQ